MLLAIEQNLGGFDEAFVHGWDSSVFVNLGKYLGSPEEILLAMSVKKSKDFSSGESGS